MTHNQPPHFFSGLWRKIHQTKGSIINFYLLISILLLPILGPILWPVNPNQQNLSQILLPPSFSKEIYILENLPPYTEKVFSFNKQNIILKSTPNTEAIHLEWTPYPEADHYQIYRNIQAFSKNNTQKGLPLIKTNQTHWIDSIGLESTSYQYTLISFKKNTILNEVNFTVTPVSAISFAEASLLNPSIDKQTKTIDFPAHPLGTDHLGRDILARLIQGSQISLFIGLFVPFICTIIGTIYGSLAGLYGGRIDDIMMRFADFVIALPFLLFMILIRIALGVEQGDSGISAMILSMIILMWPGTARLVRGQVLQIREKHFIQSAYLSGNSGFRLVIKHILPNILGVILVSFAFSIPGAIFTEAFLSFISMGVSPPSASWGSIANEGIKHMLSHPSELIFSSLLISVTVLSFNLLGDLLQDYLETNQI